MSNNENSQLMDMAMDTHNQVAQLQANVNALTEKQRKFQRMLAEAETKRTKALSDKNLLDAVLQNALELKESSAIATAEITKANAQTQSLATDLKDLIDKLIYAAEMINKMGNTVLKLKARNPLLSNELVASVSSNSTDADKAVALTLTALDSAIKAQTTNTIAEPSLSLTKQQSAELYERLTGNNSSGSSKSLKAFIDGALSRANNNYVRLIKANAEISRQLAIATTALEKAKVSTDTLHTK